MKKKNLIALAFALVLTLSLGMVLSSCGEEADDATVDEDLIYQMNEGEDGEQPTSLDKKKVEQARKLNEDEENFYGTWVAYGPEVENLYGSLEVTINEDGTVDIDVTGEKDSGTWHKIDGGISYKGELMAGKIYYGPTCQMIIEEKSEDSTISVLMEKQ